MKHDTDRAWIEVSISHLRHNVQQIQKVLPPGCELMAVVKTGAYGHGAAEISVHLITLGVRPFVVAVLKEGIGLG